MKKAIAAMVLSLTALGAMAKEPTHITISAGEDKPLFNKLPVYDPCGRNTKVACMDGWVKIKGIEITRTRYSPNEYEKISYVDWLKGACTKQQVTKNSAGIVTVDCYKKVPFEDQNCGITLKDRDKYLEEFRFNEDDILEAPSMRTMFFR